MIELLILLVIILVLLAVVVYLLDREHRAFKAWDIERGRYVAALLSQAKNGDGVASTIVRPRPQSGMVKSEEPKPVIYQEGM